MGCELCQEPVKLKLSSHSVEKLRELGVVAMAFVSFDLRLGPVLSSYWNRASTVVRRLMRDPMLLAELSVIAKVADCVRLRNSAWVALGVFSTTRNAPNTVTPGYVVLHLSGPPSEKLMEFLERLRIKVSTCDLRDAEEVSRRVEQALQSL